MGIIKELAEELNIGCHQTEAAARPTDEGNTIPFIVRYHKEVTSPLNDEVLRNLDERLRYLRNLEGRKAQVVASISEQEKLAPELELKTKEAQTLVAVGDLYRPYKPKRCTRAMIVREKDLEPLINVISSQMTKEPLEFVAAAYISEDKGVLSATDAIQEAKDILVEHISDNTEYRTCIRNAIMNKGVIQSAAKDEKAQPVYEMYYNYEESVKECVGHRILALNRGESEKIPTVETVALEDQIPMYLEKQTIVKNNPYTIPLLKEVASDSHVRPTGPSIKREIRSELTERIKEGAIKVLGKNLEQFLMQPPIVGRVVLGWDPAFRIGYKLAVVDSTGGALDTAVIYPTAPQDKAAEAKKILKDFI